MQTVAQRFTELRDKTTGATGVLGDLHTKFQLIAQESQVFGDSFNANTAKIQATQAAINTLISAGVSPFSAAVQDLIAKLRDLKNNQEEAAQAAKDHQAALQAEAQAAQAQAVAIGNVAHGGGQIVGNAASRDELQKIVEQAAQTTAQAIRSGDKAGLSKIVSDLAAFAQSFGTFNGQKTIPGDIESAISAIRNAALSAGGGTFGGSGFGGGITGELNAALEDYRKTQQAAVSNAATASTATASKGITDVAAAARGFAASTFEGPTFNPKIAMSPAVPFADGIENMKANLAGVATSLPDLVYRAQLQIQQSRSVARRPASRGVRNKSEARRARAIPRATEPAAGGGQRTGARRSHRNPRGRYGPRKSRFGPLRRRLCG